MGPTAEQAIWLLPAVTPIAFFVAFSDLSRMKIPNVAVMALVAVFAVVGLIVYPTEVWAWRWLHLVVALVVGFFLNMAGAFGAGDAKFIAAAAPFVALQDVSLVFILLAGCMVAGYLAHRIARASPLRRMVPHWESWSSGRRFPMGFPLAGTLLAYLALPFLISA